MRGVIILALTVLLTVPAVTFAAETGFLGPIVPSCAYAQGETCRACDLVALVSNILRFLVAFSVLVATGMFAYAGVLYVTASTAPKNIESAKSIFSSVFIGLVLVLAAWLIVDLMLRTLTGSDLNVLTNIECVKYSTTPVVGSVDPLLSNEVAAITEEFAYGELGLLTDAEARAYANELGLTVAPGVSTMEGTAKSTLDNAKALKDACGCEVVITSTTGGTHSTRGDCTHGGGCKFDARSRDEGAPLKAWIVDNLTPISSISLGSRYKDGCGNIYIIESSHVDVSASKPCPAHLIKTRG